MKDAFAETYTVQINPAGIKLYANNPTSQDGRRSYSKMYASAHTQPQAHTHTQTWELHFYFLPGRVLKRLSAIHIPFVCETKCSAQVCTKIKKENEILLLISSVYFCRVTVALKYS